MIALTGTRLQKLKYTQEEMLFAWHGSTPLIQRELEGLWFMGTWVELVVKLGLCQAGIIQEEWSVACG